MHTYTLLCKYLFDHSSRHIDVSVYKIPSKKINDLPIKLS
jgi:hypothetical protein